MISKPWDVCHAFGCRRPTVSGKSERELAKRHCRVHAPGTVDNRRRFAERAKVARMRAQFGTFAARDLEIGDVVEVKPPFVMQPKNEKARAIVVEVTKRFGENGCIVLGLARYAYPNLIVDFVELARESELEVLERDDFEGVLGARLAGIMKQPEEKIRLVGEMLFHGGIWWERSWNGERLEGQKLFGSSGRSQVHLKEDSASTKKNDNYVKVFRTVAGRKLGVYGNFESQTGNP